MDLENISSDIMDKVITEMNSYHYNSFSNEDTIKIKHFRKCGCFF